MESVINKLRNTVTTVTSTVSQLSVVLPGNPVNREFEVIKHIASGGPGLLWKIYSGYKKSTKQEASVFVFEKKLLDKWNKKDREVMLEVLRKGVQQLTKLRHPRVLTVQHPLEESRDSLAFATEPVFGSLANVLGSYENCPTPLPSDMKKYKLDDTEIKYGLLQISEAITFLHRDARLLHGNLCPESIVINEQGAWKLFGFEFSIAAVGTGAETRWTCNEYESERNPLSQPQLDYIAPEYITNLSCSPSSDMFSLGMVLFAIYNLGKPLSSSGNNLNSHRHNLKTLNTLSDLDLKSIPPEIRMLEKNLLSFTPTLRPDSHQFSKVEYFLNDEGVKTLNYLDTLFQWDNLQKSKFYKSLIDFLPKLPHRIRLWRVIPCLSQEFTNPTMVPFVLPNILKITEWSSDEEYVKRILPYLRDVMKLREPVQILFIFMKNMELLLQKTPSDITKSDLLPLIYGSLESDSSHVQELCLSISPSFAGLIDHQAMKTSLLPRIKKLCLNTPSLSVRVNCLVCIGKILDHLDKWLVMDFVIPLLTEIPSKEPAVIMGILGILKLVFTNKTMGLMKEIKLIASTIIPFLFPLTIESGLTVPEFTKLMTFIHELIAHVETEQRRKLEEISSVSKENAKNSFDFGDSNNKMHNSISLDFGELMSRSSTGSGTISQKQTGNTSGGGMLSSQALTSKSTNVSPNARHVPKDLTSSLIDSQLKQMSLTPAPQTNRTPSSISPSISANNISTHTHSQFSTGGIPQQQLNMNSNAFNTRGGFGMPGGGSMMRPLNQGHGQGFNQNSFLPATNSPMQFQAHHQPINTNPQNQIRFQNTNFTNLDFISPTLTPPAPQKTNNNATMDLHDFLGGG